MVAPRMCRGPSPASARRAAPAAARAESARSDRRTTMVEIPEAGRAPAANRLDRRKARTRQALIDAAVHLIAEGRGERASIQEITEVADVGFGSFYNHFASKEELFDTASADVLERWGQMIDQACEGIGDPAELFAVSFRISGRLGWTHPDIARFLTGAGLALLDDSNG